MLTYRLISDNGQKRVETSFSGKALLSISQLNKGTAFSAEEREEFDLLGKLPPHIETLEEQAERAYLQYQACENVLNRNIFLNQLLNTNQVLFYYLIEKHLQEMLPTIYTPIVGNAVQSYHKRFQQPRGLYISYPDRYRIEEILRNRTNPNISLIVTSDGEGVLGIGDQGIGAMAIPIAKLMVYTAFAGINPMNTLPVMLDAGTNNQALLDDPMYLGWHNPRISGKEYNEFIDCFVAAVKKIFPDVYLHWEDFGRTNAFRHLLEYRKSICSFNDDIQGTGVVALAALMSGLKKTGGELKDQRIVVFGAGSAGMGVTDRIYRAIKEEIGEDFAHQRFWLLDRPGLLTEYVIDETTEAQRPFCRSAAEIDQWGVNDAQNIGLMDVIKHVKPTILIGCSAVSGAFSDPIIKEMVKHVEHPIILPLSNPNEKCEAKPSDLLEWTKGKAYIATGSPFDDVEYDGKTYPISQCNNYFAFPGIGLGIIAVKPTRLTSKMLMAASKALSDIKLTHPYRLLPKLERAQELSRAIGIAVAKQAIEEGLAIINPQKTVEQLVDETMWSPQYLPYRYVS
ncbi:MAG: NAD-dependent malic enzyme [Coxiellaceae bacterium]|nr:NAD-dependent malic enzyme [Coxiellaceae bacterium]